MPPYGILENKWLSRSGIETFTGVSKALDLLYNSGRYNNALASLEKKYPSAFSMYAEISKRVKETGGLNKTSIANFISRICD
jgi:hypothetical protein